MFAEQFTEQDREDFVSVVKDAFKQGYFSISDKYYCGCEGLHCNTPNNAFYCLPPSADTWEGTPEEYIEYEGVDGICQDIANTILGMFEEELEEDHALGEGHLYILELCHFVNDAPVLRKLMKIADDSGCV